MKKIFLSLTFAISVMSCFSQKTLNPGDTMGIWNVINFDTTYNCIYIDTTSGNLWQIGVPQKTNFSSSWSPSKAILTDTLNNYPANNHSWFDLYAGSFNFNGNYPQDLFFDFKHKFDTDTLRDGGYITVSWDNGQTFNNVIHDNGYLWGLIPGGSYLVPDPQIYTDADTLFNGEQGFSGSSRDWKHTTLAWHMTPVKQEFPPDTMIIRFNFISDNINNPHDGWMIDDVRLFSLDLGGGIHDLSKSNSLMKISPNPFKSQAEIIFKKPHKTIKVELYNLQGDLLYSNEYANCSKIILNLASLSSGTYLLKSTIDNAFVETKKVVFKE